VPVPHALAATAASAAIRTRTASHLRRVLLALLALGALLMAVLLSSMIGALERSDTGASHRPSGAAVADIPAGYLRLYLAAGRRYNLDWAILAGIGSIETDHGRLHAPGVRSGANVAGAMGPMQFLAATFRAYGVDGNHDGRTHVYDPADAIPAAARLLRDNGAPRDYERAIFAYNHANWYVQDVLARAARYRGALRDAPPNDIARIRADRENIATLLRNKRITLTLIQRADLQSGTIDPRLITILTALARDHTIVVTALKTDHAPGTNHEAGRAADIGAVDGTRCDGSRSGPCARVARWLARIQGELRPTELIYAWDPDPSDPRDFADPRGHDDHIHVGWDA
jgi:hypothetical protein